MNAVRAAALASALCLSVMACGQRWEERRACDAVKQYNRALIEAYRSSNAAALLECAGEREIDRVRVLIDLKSSSGLVLESVLESFETVAVALQGGAATVRTRERWTYHDRPTTPGAGPGPVFAADMEMEYDVVRKDGRWIVDRGRTISNAMKKIRDRP